MDADDLLAAGHVEHVALAEELLGPLFAKDGAAVDLRRHLTADAGGPVGLDAAGDDIHRGALRAHAELDARRPRLPRQPLDEVLHLLARRPHSNVKPVAPPPEHRPRSYVDGPILIR